MASGHGEVISATAGNSNMMMPTLSAVARMELSDPQNEIERWKSSEGSC